MHRTTCLVAVGMLLVSGAGNAGDDAVEVHLSTCHPLAPAALLKGNTTILSGAGERIDDAAVLAVNGCIEAVGQRLRAPRNARDRKP